MNLIPLQAAGAQGGGLQMIIMMVVLFAIMYFFMIRPQQKKQKELQKMRDALKVGDRVVVEMDDSQVMAASATAYLIPFAGLAAGLGLGYLLGGVITAINGELLMALTGVAGTAVAYVVMRALDPRLSKGRWEPRIVSVIPPDEENK